MTAREYVHNRLTQIGTDNASLGDKVYHLRSPQTDDEKGGVPLPSIVWRQESADRVNALDGPTDITAAYFEIECRSEVVEFDADGEKGAGMMAKTVVDYLTPRLTHILADYDDEDRVTERSDFVSHIVLVGISDSV